MPTQDLQFGHAQPYYLPMCFWFHIEWQYEVCSIINQAYAPFRIALYAALAEQRVTCAVHYNRSVPSMITVLAPQDIATW